MLTGSLPPVRMEVPHEPGEWIDVRQLGYTELEACRDAVTKKFFDNLRTMGTDVVAQFTQMQQAQPELIAEAQAAKDAAQPDQFDRTLLFQKSVVAWSYQPAFTPDLLPQLDERTAEWLYRAITQMYTGEGESDEDRGNAYTPSTVS